MTLKKIKIWTKMNSKVKINWRGQSEVAKYNFLD